MNEMERDEQAATTDSGWSRASAIKAVADALIRLDERTVAGRPCLPHNIPSLPITYLPEEAFPDKHHESIVEWLSTHITPYLTGSSLSPNYYGFITGGTTPVALLADVLVSFFDQNVAVHLPRETIATNVEVAALNMLLDLFGLPRGKWGIGGCLPGGGIFTTGATASNVLGLALGREWILAAKTRKATGKSLSVGQNGLLETTVAAGITKIQVLSTMPHSSIAKAASTVGIGRHHVIHIAKAGESLEIDMVKLKQEASRPGVATILALSAGEVNTGRFATNSFSQLHQLRDICDSYDVWIHVDGAFGLFGAALSGVEDESSYAEIINGCQGLGFADSITGDGHKLLNVPYDCGFFFTRHKQLAEEVFSNGNVAYLSAGVGAGDGILSPLNIGIENSRRFRALPVYASLIAYGRQGYQGMLKRQVGLARRVAAWLYDHDQYELLPQGENRETMMAKTFIVVLFRAKNPVLNKLLVQTVNADRRMYITGTQWDGIPAARIAVSNWQADVERDGNLIEKVLSELVQ